MGDATRTNCRFAIKHVGPEALILQHPSNEPSESQMVKELIAAGWSPWDQMVTVWQTPDGGLMFGTRIAWELMAKTRARILDS